MRIQGTKSALLAVMAFASALVVDAETLYSDGAVLSLAEHNGAVEFMRGADGVPRADWDKISPSRRHPPATACAARSAQP